MKIVNIEDIYPLTIISMRYGGKIVIFNMESDNSIITNVQLSEERMLDLEDFLSKILFTSCYGIGNTVWEAFEDYKKRYKEINN